MKLSEKFNRLKVISVDPSLRCTGLYSSIIGENGITFSHKIYEGERFSKLVEIYNFIKVNIQDNYIFGKSKCYDIMLVEDYAFSSHSRSVTTMAEVGGVIRMCASSHMLEIFEIPSTFWKKHSGFGKTRKKTTAKENIDYVEYAKCITGNIIDFKNPDEADSYMIYLAVYRALLNYDSGLLKEIPECLNKIISYLQGT